ncbi:MAG: hypothetical protein ACRDNG_08235 [Gaiellaceae bacterium]
MRGRRGVALLGLGLVLVAMVVTPAGAHVGSMSHFWTKHMKPFAAKLFYTKKQSDARYHTKAGSDARYYTKAGSDARYYTAGAADARFALKGETLDSGLHAYCSRAAASPRSYPNQVSAAPLVVRVDVTGVVGDPTSVGVGVDGLPVVSYRDGTKGDLSVLHCGNVACTSGNVVTPVDPSADPLGYHTSIAIGADGYPIVSYYDGSSNDLKFLRCGNTACTAGNEAVALDTGGTVGQYTSIALGADGVPVVSYYDPSNGDLKLARPPVS